jgi:P22_AR N-terminal domain
MGLGPLPHLTGIEPVPFDDDDQLEAIRGDGEKQYVVPKRICENLGVDWAGQYTKLKDDPTACVEIISTHDTSGRQQETCVIPIIGRAWRSSPRTTQAEDPTVGMVIITIPDARGILQETCVIPIPGQV